MPRDSGINTQHADLPSGILVLDKPLRMSSMAAVAEVRRRVGAGRRFKVGHAGTLDPLAIGVLVIAVGAATKFIDRFMATDKHYETTIDLSAFTTTDDLEGERTEIQAAHPPLLQRVDELLRTLVGEIAQRPPAFSAVKINGRRAYKMARSGLAPEPQSRKVIVHSLNLVRYEWPQLQVQIHCGKGFYVRSLARDIGEALGTGGHCTSIRRTAVGPFTIDLARQLDDLPTPLTNNDLMPVDESLRMLGVHP